jgi:hypothetical protein
MFIGVALALVVGLVWVPAVAALSADIIIHKTVEEGCPLDETFCFEAWRDMNDNGVLDAGDVLVGTVCITGEGTGVITVSVFGPYVIHEVPVPGWAPNPDQPVFVACDEQLYFHNERCTGQIQILKLDLFGTPLPGATFEICPDPKTGAMPCLIVEDNGLNDEDPADGVLLVTGVKVCVPVTVTETVAPPGYDLDPTPYPAHVTECGETVVLTIVNIPTEEEGELEIIKRHICGFLLGGATFLIEPNPQTGAGSLTVIDNGLNDEDPAAGKLLVTGCIEGQDCIVTETVPPPGYVAGPAQPVTITGSLTFFNKPWWWRWINWV